MDKGTKLLVSFCLFISRKNFLKIFDIDFLQTAQKIVNIYCRGSK